MVQARLPPLTIRQIPAHTDRFLYVADRYNNKIRRVSKAGVVPSVSVSTTISGPTQVLFPPNDANTILVLQNEGSRISTLTLNCPAGQRGVDSECTQCPANTFSNGGTITSCTSCGGGTSSTAGGSTCTNLNCATGEYVNGNTCTQCSANTFSNGGSTSSCTNCPANLCPMS